eukprot:TRINITY_DN39341_c0_g1_i1.p1 TRINITY_DN39341_c0_g1~~TRINITY_DN39341_c0_g1_i1.p1  ORF type:complete len:828 (-),score=181.14 TRINITY_DN39341_c0_g1_i1:102-2585(-)
MSALWARLRHAAWQRLLRLAASAFTVDVLHEWTQTTATLLLKLPPGHQKVSLKILQITDVHLSEDPLLLDERAFAERMHVAFTTKSSIFNGSEIQPIAAFRELLDLAVDEQVDLVALTGDLFNFPQLSMVSAVSSMLESRLKPSRHGVLDEDGEVAEAKGIPYVFTSGNHDWFYEGMNASQEALWKKWRRKRLQPLYSHSAIGQPPDGADVAGDGVDFGAVVIGGMLVITIDNALFQITEEQLSFFREQMLRKLPSILMLHVPLSVRQELRPFHRFALSGDPAWGHDSDISWTHERRDRWPKSGNTKATELFLEAVSASAAPHGPLVAVLSGHVHEHSAAPFDTDGQPIGGAVGTAQGGVQYISLAGCSLGFRYIDVRMESRPEGVQQPPLTLLDFEGLRQQRATSSAFLYGLSKGLLQHRWRGGSCWAAREQHLSAEKGGLVDTAWITTALELMLERTQQSMRLAFVALADALRPLLEGRFDRSCHHPAAFHGILGRALAEWADPKELVYVRGRSLAFGGPKREVVLPISRMLKALKEGMDFDEVGEHLGCAVEITARGRDSVCRRLQEEEALARHRALLRKAVSGTNPSRTISGTRTEVSIKLRPDLLPGWLTFAAEGGNCPARGSEGQRIEKEGMVVIEAEDPPGNVQLCYRLRGEQEYVLQDTEIQVVPVEEVEEFEEFEWADAVESIEPSSVVAGRETEVVIRFRPGALPGTVYIANADGICEEPGSYLERGQNHGVVVEEHDPPGTLKLCYQADGELEPVLLHKGLTIEAPMAPEDEEAPADSPRDSEAQLDYAAEGEEHDDEAEQQEDSESPHRKKEEEL